METWNGVTVTEGTGEGFNHGKKGEGLVKNNNL